MKEMKVRVTFINPMLGTVPGDPDLYKNWIATHAPDAKTKDEEVAEFGVDATVEKGVTYFRRDENNQPYLYNYMFKGFFKQAARANNKIPNSLTSGMKAYIKEIDTLIFINERKIVVHTDKPITFLTRPLRAQTMQGERVSLAISEMIQEGATCEFTVRCLVDSDIPYVREWLDYGVNNGIGQWRNAEYGTFKWDEIDDNGNVIPREDKKDSNTKKTTTKATTAKKATAKKTTTTKKTTKKTT